LSRYRSFRDLDWSLLVITLIICALGILQIYSATQNTKWSDAWWKQGLWVLVAIGIMWVTSCIDYHTLLGQVPILYGLSIASLLATFAVGKMVFGSRRWIRVPGVGFNFQISEFVKLVIILLVARCLSELKRDEVGWRELLKLGVLVGIPTALVMKQAGFGNVVDVPSGAGRRSLLAGIRWRYLAGDRGGGRVGDNGRVSVSAGLPERIG